MKGTASFDAPTVETPRVREALSEEALEAQKARLIAEWIQGDAQLQRIEGELGRVRRALAALRRPEWDAQMRFTAVGRGDEIGQ